MRTALQGYDTPVPLRLAALWAATMFCYIYGDYFGLYAAGTIADMTAGRLGPLGPATPGMLLGVAAMMAVPSVMVVVTLVLPPRLDRWLNIVLGITYTAIIAVTLPGSPLFYVGLGIVEMVLTLAIVVVAWRWPRIPASG